MKKSLIPGKVKQQVNLLGLGEWGDPVVCKVDGTLNITLSCDTPELRPYLADPYQLGLDRSGDLIDFLGSC